MNEITKEVLKTRLLEEGYKEEYGLDETMDRLLNLNGDARLKLYEWLYEGKIPTFKAIEGVDSSILRENLQMKEPAIILSYAMLLHNPEINSIYLKNLLKKVKRSPVV